VGARSCKDLYTNKRSFKSVLYCTGSQRREIKDGVTCQTLTLGCACDLHAGYGQRRSWHEWENEKVNKTWWLGVCWNRECVCVCVCVCVCERERLYFGHVYPTYWLHVTCCLGSLKYNLILFCISINVFLLIILINFIHTLFHFFKAFFDQSFTPMLFYLLILLVYSIRTIAILFYLLILLDCFIHSILFYNIASII